MALTQEGVKFSDFVRGLPSASEADLATGNNMPIVSTSNIKKMGGENVGKGSVVRELQEAIDIGQSQEIIFSKKLTNGEFVVPKTFETGKKIVIAANGNNIVDATPSSYASWFNIQVWTPDLVTKIETIISYRKGDPWQNFSVDYIPNQDCVLKIYAYYNAAVTAINFNVADIHFYSTEIENLKNNTAPIYIGSGDIVFDVSDSVFSYPKNSVTNGKDIDVDNLTIVDRSGYLVSQILNPETDELAGIWKVFYKSAGVVTAFANVKVMLYSGSTPVKAYYYTNGADNNFVLITRNVIEQYDIDGVQFAVSSVGYSWESIAFKHDAAYTITDERKRAFLEKNGVDLKYFPREEGEADDSPRIKRALRVIRYNAFGGVLHIPAGKYTVNSSLYLGYYESVIMDDGALLEVGAAFNDYVFRYKGNCFYTSATERDHYGDLERGVYLPDGSLFKKLTTISGGTIDCNGMCSGGVWISGFRFANIENMCIMNPIEAGLQISSSRQSTYEAMVTKLHIYTNKHTLAGNIGVLANCDDCHFTDIVVTDCTIGFKSSGGANRFTRCHHWNGPISESLPNSISFDTKQCILIGCFSDTAEVGFKVDDAAKLIGCRAFVNNVFHLDSRTIVVGNPEVIGCQWVG